MKVVMAGQGAFGVKHLEAMQKIDVVDGGGDSGGCGCGAVFVDGCDCGEDLLPTGRSTTRRCRRVAAQQCSGAGGEDELRGRAHARQLPVARRSARGDRHSLQRRVVGGVRLWPARAKSAGRVGDNAAVAHAVGARVGAAAQAVARACQHQSGEGAGKVFARFGDDGRGRQR